jgi:hypothetical protein
VSGQKTLIEDQLEDQNGDVRVIFKWIRENIG